MLFRSLITNGGEGYLYQAAVSVSITGDGQFANAYAVVNTQTETIQSIIVDNYGSGYTYANATISSTVGAYANARVIISPPGGHGSDPLNELGGSYLILNPQLDGNEGGVLDTQASYRQLAILNNPIVYGSTNVSSNLTFSQLTVITLSQSSSTTNYLLGELVYQGNTVNSATYTGVVAAWDSANSLLSLNNTQGNYTSADIHGTVSGAKRTSTVTVVNPYLTPYSGNILYKDNITQISRANDQNEDFKIVLSF